MSRLTERETEEIRRAKHAVEAEARKTAFASRPADRAPARAATASSGAEGSLLARIVWPVVRAVRVHRIAAQLNRLSNSLLADIGVERGQIRLVADTLVDQTAPTAGPGVLEVLRLRRQRHWAIRELEALSDRQLLDIGLRRADIPGVVSRAQRSAAEPTAAEESSPVRAVRQWNLSRQAANEMARLDPETLTDLGYVKGDVDWVPEVLAERKLSAA